MKIFLEKKNAISKNKKIITIEKSFICVVTVAYTDGLCTVSLI